MVLNQLQALIPLIAGNLLIILASSFFGSLFILVGRSIRERRALIGALHAELIDNYREAFATSEDIKERDSDYFGAFANVQVRTSAYESLQTNDPVLYASIDAFSENLFKSYATIVRLENYKKFSFWVMLAESISFSREPVADGGYDSVPEGLEGDSENYKEWTRESIREVEEYTNETALRRAMYYGCFGESPDYEDAEN
ncbi:hypothetical protein [Natronorubrum sp. FCH18a]|uniref:hypothetical protein n=1 Tax=Natronorubrum sp. FCH18a TaxID=3447018 RepID=UPI003F517332